MRREWTKLRAKVRGTKMLTYSRKNARKVVDGRKEPAYYAGLNERKNKTPQDMRREWTKLRAKVHGTKMLTYSRKNARKVVDVTNNKE